MMLKHVESNLLTMMPRVPTRNVALFWMMVSSRSLPKGQTALVSRKAHDMYVWQVYRALVWRPLMDLLALSHEHGHGRLLL